MSTSLNYRHNILKFAILLSVCLSAFLEVAAETKIEIAHWWTSESEAKAIQVFKDALNGTQYHWEDSATAGGAGENLIKILHTRIAAGKPPAAVQMYMGPNVKSWAEEGVLVDLTPLAKAENWDSILPKTIKDLIQYEGRYFAVPVNAHRINWLWANSNIINELGITAPDSFNDFWASLKKIKKAGYIPIALGGQPWQELTLFEVVLLGIGGKNFHQQVFAHHDRDAIKSDLMRHVLNEFRRVKQFTDSEALGRSWDQTTRLVIDGKAAFQFIGDWAKGEFLAMDKQTGVDFQCFPSPGTKGFFLIDTDTFAMFQTHNKDIEQGQMKLASLVMNKILQQRFNKIKGSAPARLDIDPMNFDQCGRNSINSLRAAAKTDNVIPSFTFYHSSSASMRASVMELISVYFNSNMPVETAVSHLSTLMVLAR